MKSLYLQIEFIDTKLLPCFGIKGILDYQNIIYTGEKDQELNHINLESINELIEDFREIFNSRNFNLHKTQYKIKTHKQAICLLKICLEVTSIPHDHSVIDGKKILRLISKNNILEKYINTLKMTDLRNSETNNYYTPIQNTTKTISAETCNKEQLLANVKKIHKSEIILSPSKLLHISEDLIEPEKKLHIDLKKYFQEQSISSIKLKFISKKHNDIDILSPQYIEHIINTYNILYRLEIGYAILKDKFIQENEIIMSDIIIPIKSLCYHSFNLVLFNIDKIINLLDNLELKVEYSTVDFYADFESKLKTIALELNIEHHKKYNVIRFMSGMSGFGYSEFLTKSQFDTLNTPQKQINTNTTNLIKENMVSEIKLEGTIEYFNEIEGYNLSKLSSNSDYLYPLCYGYNFVSYIDTITIKNINLSYYKYLNNRTLFHGYNIGFADLSTCDTLGFLEIIIENIENIPDINSVLNIYPVCGLETLYDKSFEYTITHNQIKIFVDTNNQINLMNKLTGLVGIELEFRTNLNVEDILTEPFVLFVKKYYWNNSVRKMLSINNDIFVNIDKNYLVSNDDELKPLLSLDNKNKNRTRDIRI